MNNKNNVNQNKNKSNTKIIIIVVIVVVLIFAISRIKLIFDSATTVTDSVSKAKQSVFNNASDVVANWFEIEYRNSINEFDNSEEFVKLCGQNGDACKKEINLTSDILEKNGLKKENIDLKKSTVLITEEIVCVKLVATMSGQYKGLNDAYSNGCTN